MFASFGKSRNVTMLTTPVSRDAIRAQAREPGIFRHLPWHGRERSLPYACREPVCRPGQQNDVKRLLCSFSVPSIMPYPVFFLRVLLLQRTTTPNANTTGASEYRLAPLRGLTWWSVNACKRISLGEGCTTAAHPAWTLGEIFACRNCTVGARSIMSRQRGSVSRAMNELLVVKMCNIRLDTARVEGT